MVSLTTLDEESTLTFAFATINDIAVQGELTSQKEISINSYKQGFEDEYTRMQELALTIESQDNTIFVKLLSEAFAALKYSKKLSNLYDKHYHLGRSWGIIMGFFEFFCTSPLIAEKLVTHIAGRGRVIEQIKIVLQSYREELNDFPLTQPTLRKALSVITDRIKMIKRSINFQDEITDGMIKHFLDSMIQILS